MKTKEQDLSTTKYIDVAQLMAYVHCGRNSAMALGKDAGAMIKIGHLTRYDRDVIDEYLRNARIPKRDVPEFQRPQNRTINQKLSYEERILNEIDRIEREAQTIRDILKENEYFDGGEE